MPRLYNSPAPKQRVPVCSPKLASVSFSPFRIFIEKGPGHPCASSVLRCRLDQCRYRAPAVRHTPVWSVGMNLISFGLRLAETARHHNAAARCISLDGVSHRCCVRKPENMLQHLDNILERMLLVIEDDDVIKLLQ